MATNTLIVYCTCPDDATATQLAEYLLEKRLVACVNIIDSVSAIYRWQGKIERSTEKLMLIKTTKSAYSEVESALKHQHPYELPEIIAVSVEQGLPEYLKWVEECSLKN